MSEKLNRRDFLKVARTGLGALVLGWLLVGDESEFEVKFESEYYSRFKRSVRRAVHAEVGEALPPLDLKTAEKVVQIGDKMHELAERGLYRWESSEAYVGTSAIHTRISVLDMAAELAEKEGNTELARQAKTAIKNKAGIEQRVDIVFSSMTGLLPTDGEPFPAFDMAMERIGIAMMQTINGLKRGKPISEEVLCVGKQLAMAGQVTKEMIKDMKTDPFGVQAKLDAEVIRGEVLKHRNRAKILLLGQSWGGAEAALALRMYEELYGPDNKIKGLVDDPTPLWAGNNLFSGAVVSAAEAFRDRYDDYLAKIWFPGVYRDVLWRKHLYIPSTPGQEDLKEQGNERLRKALEEGPKPGRHGGVLPEFSRLFIRQACGDKTLSDEVRGQMREVVHMPGVEEHAELFFRSGGHDFDRFKISNMLRWGVAAELICGW
jgi:hypothetical protein